MENSELEAKYQEIKKWVITNEYMSVSRIQRECSVGFNLATRIFKRLQDEGIVAVEADENKGYPVLVKNRADKVNKPLICHKCGNKLNIDFKYCPYCGTSIIEETSK